VGTEEPGLIGADQTPRFARRLGGAELQAALAAEACRVE